MFDRRESSIPIVSGETRKYTFSSDFRDQDRLIIGRMYWDSCIDLNDSSGYDTYLFDFSNPYNSENSSFNIFLLLKKLFPVSGTSFIFLKVKLLITLLISLKCFLSAKLSLKFWTFFCDSMIIFIIFAQSQNQTNSINYAE